MNICKRLIICGTVLLTTMLIGGGVGAKATVPYSEPIGAPSPTQSQVQSALVTINEIMPKPDTGEYEWVELLTHSIHRIYLPLVLKGYQAGSAANSKATGLAVGASSDINLVGYEITDEDGNTYTIPGDLPPAPDGAFVLIYFGDGTDDYDWSDNKAVLYAGSSLANIFEDAGDQVVLYSSSSHSAETIVDFVAWGIEPEEDATNAAAVGIWQPDWFATFESGFGDTSDEDVLAPNESLGRYPGSTGIVGPQAFAEYQSDQLTPGGANPVPMPSFYTPENGAIVETTGFSVSWAPVPGAASYRFQLDDDQAFGDPLYDTTVTESYFEPPTPLAAGTYYWRIKAIGSQGEEGPWLGPVQIGIVVFSTQTSVQAEVVLGITPVRQNKDSRMICLVRDPEGDPTTNNPENAWDAPAPCTVPPCTNTIKYEHGRMYCVVASIRMMASHYGGTLSMDRIAYHIAQEWTGNTRPGTNDDNPNNDVAHNKGWYYHDEEDEGISWALGTTIIATGGKPSFNAIKAWINANRPIMFRNPGHMMVMDGYREQGGNQYIHVLDPDQPPDCWRWQDYSTQTIDGHWPGPASAPYVRSDESSVSNDTDGDGIVDFDETYRFLTSPTNADTDGDRVPDKKDMREYVFDSTGGFLYRNADWDSDTLRKERDPDNDNDGSLDGCEDTDHDGIYEAAAGETNNFDNTSTKQCGFGYDSGWISLETDQALMLIHNLGGDTDDYVVDMQYRTDDVNGVNQRYYGGVDFGAKAFSGTMNDKRVSAYWRSLTTSSITVYRRPDDIYAEQIRIRIWLSPSPDYDSGWIDLVAGAAATVLNHGLGDNADHYVVDMQYRMDDVNGVNQRYFGGTDFGATAFGGGHEDERAGLYWRSLNNASITIFRRAEDIYTPEARVRIWVRPTPAYDSGWVSLDEDAAQTLTHNLGGDPADYVVDMQYRASDVNGVNLRYYGGADFGANPAPGHNVDDRVAAYWRSLTASSVIVYRRPEDTYAPEVRIRIFTPVYRVVYIYDDDLTTAESYKELLEANDITVDLLPLNQVVETNFGPYHLIIIGPDTGYLDSWGDKDTLAQITGSGKPILGLGEGGYAFFGKLGLDIGWGKGWHGDENRILVVDPDHAIYKVPYAISIPAPDPILTVYNTTTHVGIHLLEPPGDVTVLGREPDNETHYPLVQQTAYYLLWGFSFAPSDMTATGQQLFVNTAWHMLH